MSGAYARRRARLAVALARATTEVRTVKRRHIKQKRDPVTKEVLFEFVEERTGPVKYHRQTRLRDWLRDWLAGQPPGSSQSSGASRPPTCGSRAVRSENAGPYCQAQVERSPPAPRHRRDAPPVRELKDRDTRHPSGVGSRGSWAGKDFRSSMIPPNARRPASRSGASLTDWTTGKIGSIRRLERTSEGSWTPSGGVWAAFPASGASGEGAARAGRPPGAPLRPAGRAPRGAHAAPRRSGSWPRSSASSSVSRFAIRPPRVSGLAHRRGERRPCFSRVPRLKTEFGV